MKANHYRHHQHHLVRQTLHYLNNKLFFRDSQLIWFVHLNTFITYPSIWNAKDWSNNPIPDFFFLSLCWIFFAHTNVIDVINIYLHNISKKTCVSSSNHFSIRSYFSLYLLWHARAFIFASISIYTQTNIHMRLMFECIPLLCYSLEHAECF